MHLQDLKNKSPADLLKYAEELEIENASTLRKQDILFTILKRITGNNLNFDIKIILNRIVYDSDVKSIN